MDAGDSITIRFVAQVPGTYTFYCDKQLLFFPATAKKEWKAALRFGGQSMMKGQRLERYLLHDVLKQVSRSFYLTLAVLPGCVAKQVGLAYLFARQPTPLRMQARWTGAPGSSCWGNSNSNSCRKPAITKMSKPFKP